MGSSNKARNNDLCHICGKPGHLIKDCPLAKLDQDKQNPKKVAKKTRFQTSNSIENCCDNIVKKTLAEWGDFSSESEREPDAENSSMIVVEIEATKYDSLFALMAQFDDDEEDEDDEVNFRVLQGNL